MSGRENLLLMIFKQRLILEQDRSLVTAHQCLMVHSCPLNGCFPNCTSDACNSEANFNLEAEHCRSETQHGGASVEPPHKQQSKHWKSNISSSRWQRRGVAHRPHAHQVPQARHPVAVSTRPGILPLFQTPPAPQARAVMPGTRYFIVWCLSRNLCSF